MKQESYIYEVSLTYFLRINEELRVIKVGKH